MSDNREMKKPNGGRFMLRGVPHWRWKLVKVETRGGKRPSETVEVKLKLRVSRCLGESKKKRSLRNSGDFWWIYFPGKDPRPVFLYRTASSARHAHRRRLHGLFLLLTQRQESVFIVTFWCLGGSSSCRQCRVSTSNGIYSIYEKLGYFIWRVNVNAEVRKTRCSRRSSGKVWLEPGVQFLVFQFRNNDIKNMSVRITRKIKRLNVIWLHLCMLPTTITLF